MTSFRIIGLALLVAGLLGIAYGGFSYTTEDTAAKLGPIELKVEETHRVNVPLWAGLLGLAAGGGLLLAGSRRR